MHILYVTHFSFWEVFCLQESMQWLNFKSFMLNSEDDTFLGNIDLKSFHVVWTDLLLVLRLLMARCSIWGSKKETPVSVPLACLFSLRSESSSWQSNPGSWQEAASVAWCPHCGLSCVTTAVCPVLARLAPTPGERPVGAAQTALPVLPTLPQASYLQESVRAPVLAPPLLKASKPSRSAL